MDAMAPMVPIIIGPGRRTGFLGGVAPRAPLPAVEHGIGQTRGVIIVKVIAGRRLMSVSGWMMGLMLRHPGRRTSHTLLGRRLTAVGSRARGGDLVPHRAGDDPPDALRDAAASPPSRLGLVGGGARSRHHGAGLHLSHLALLGLTNLPLCHLTFLLLAAVPGARSGARRKARYCVLQSRILTYDGVGHTSSPPCGRAGPGGRAGGPLDGDASGPCLLPGEEIFALDLGPAGRAGAHPLDHDRHGRGVGDHRFDTLGLAAFLFDLHPPKAPVRRNGLL
mmetsp:Transcript_1932/g.5101  ORF Transcript_1932/g.5101 Transcript_1932/m.5101 type:complete len:278 (-) Transcript_1932:688-1521(-)